MPIRVLFVDDNASVLASLRRLLRPLQSEWDMQFVLSAAAALELLASELIDVVVSDFHMPKMDGDEFLALVRERYPRIVRLVLSGQNDAVTTRKLVPLAHRFLSKPCTFGQIKETVESSFSFQGLLHSPALVALVSQLGGLPTPPLLHTRILQAMDKPDAAIADIADLIADDVAMAAKVMQVANSAFFGTNQPVADLRRAVLRLGADATVSLVMASGIFTRYDPAKLAPFSIDELWAHSRAVGELAGKIAKAEKKGHREVGEAQLAGLFHDIGRLVLVAQQADRYKEVFGLIRSEGLTISAAELRVFGTTHAEVGAYLLGLWGLPVSLVIAVACHHHPSRFPETAFSALTSVHIAEVLLDEDGSSPDLLHLEQLGLKDRLPIWEKLRDEMSA